jgi:chromosome segregation ATPase
MSAKTQARGITDEVSRVYTKGICRQARDYLEMLIVGVIEGESPAAIARAERTDACRGLLREVAEGLRSMTTCYVAAREAEGWGTEIVANLPVVKQSRALLARTEEDGKSSIQTPREEAIANLCESVDALRARLEGAERELDLKHRRELIWEQDLASARNSIVAIERQRDGARRELCGVTETLEQERFNHADLERTLLSTETSRDEWRGRVQRAEAALREAERAVLHSQGNGDRAWSKCFACGRERQSSEVGVPRHKDTCPFRVLAGREPEAHPAEEK